jgi:hypothetical protein
MVALVAVIALAITGFDFPAGLKDVYDDFYRKTANKHGIGEAVVLLFALIASMMAAISVGILAVWLATRFGVGQARADLFANATAAVATVVYIVALGLLGDSWALLPTWTFAGLFVLFLASTAINRIRRKGRVTPDG